MSGTTILNPMTAIDISPALSFAPVGSMFTRKAESIKIALEQANRVHLTGTRGQQVRHANPAGSAASTLSESRGWPGCQPSGGGSFWLLDRSQPQLHTPTGPGNATPLPNLSNMCTVLICTIRNRTSRSIPLNALTFTQPSDL